MRYLLRRFGVLLLTAWVAVTVNFALPRLMPGDPVATMIAQYEGRISPEAAATLRIQFGLNRGQSQLSQYFSYLRNLLSGNLGESFQTFAPVSDTIRQSLPWTLGLVGFATILAFLIGIGLGMLAAWRRGSAGWQRNSRFDTVVVPFGVMLAAMPAFWLAMLFVYFFSFKFGWFPISKGREPGGPTSGIAGLVDLVHHAVLPAITLTLISMGGWILLMRNSMLTVLNDDFVKFARAKGLTNRAVAYHYAARNAILPVFTQLAMALGFVVGGQIFIEYVFSYPGIGFKLLGAVTSADYPLMQGIFLIITLALLVANFLAEALYFLIDPRVRTETGK